MKDEIESMVKNKVWDLVDLPNGVVAIDSKWVNKIKIDASDNVEWHKAKHVAILFIQNEGIDYHETFSPIFKKDSFRIVMPLVTHFDIKLYQMDVKMTFLNNDLEEEVHIYYNLRVLKKIDRESAN